MTRMAEQREPEVFPLAEEELHVSTRRVTKGKVRIRSVVDTIEEVVRQEISEERVEVTRVQLDQPIDAIPQVRTENDVTIIPIVEEVVVIEKRLMLREELHVRRMASMETLEVPVTRRKERAVIERLDEHEKPSS
jgi:stress response protein YsnF